jgi:DNA-binding XRE family transcriptional regulator
MRQGCRISYAVPPLRKSLIPLVSLRSPFLIFMIGEIHGERSPRSRPRKASGGVSRWGSPVMRTPSTSTGSTKTEVIRPAGIGTMQPSINCTREHRMPTPTTSIRAPREHHPIIRGIAARLRLDPGFADRLGVLLADGTPRAESEVLAGEVRTLAAQLAGLSGRLEQIEYRLRERRPQGEMKEAIERFGGMVRAERKARGWSTDDLAEKVELAERTIRHIEIGRGGNRNTRARIAAVLGLEAPDEPKPARRQRGLPSDG